MLQFEELPCTIKLPEVETHIAPPSKPALFFRNLLDVTSRAPPFFYVYCHTSNGAKHLLLYSYVLQFSAAIGDNFFTIEFLISQQLSKSQRPRNHHGVRPTTVYASFLLSQNDLARKLGYCLLDRP